MNFENFRLDWHDHTDHLRSMLHDMRKTRQYTDVTIVCDDLREFKAHKVVLSACSLAFKTMLERNDTKNPTIFLRDINSEQMEFLLQFMYLGNTQIEKASVTEFLKVAQDLKVEELVTNTTGVETSHPQTQPMEVEKQSEGFKNVDVKPSSPSKINEPEKFDCSQCDVFFSRERNLKRHVRRFHPSPVPKTKPSTNQKIEESTTVVPSPVSNPSLDVPNFVICPKCNYKADSKDQLNLHTQFVHIDEENEKSSVFCEKCGFCAETNDQLIAHTKKMHEELKFPCNQCEYKAPRLGHLKDHIISEHVKLKKH